jgi:hypothetical protein
MKKTMTTKRRITKEVGQARTFRRIKEKTRRKRGEAHS